MQSVEELFFALHAFLVLPSGDTANMPVLKSFRGVKTKGLAHSSGQNPVVGRCSNA